MNLALALFALALAMIGGSFVWVRSNWPDGSSHSLTGDLVTACGVLAMLVLYPLCLGAAIIVSVMKVWRAVVYRR